ncbi:MAG: ABC transporter ATP-binding protein [Pseudomonadota bacterium]|nr:ABC transporter ATP-binding protein [Pseudomonadota bacterium]
MELVARNVEVAASGRTILSGIDLRLRAGELCGLIGPSGAGKSTLIRVLLGLTTPARGDVTLAGAPVGTRGPVGYVPQDDALHTSLRVGDALGFAAELRMHGAPDPSRAARVREVIAQVGLSERVDVRIARLSGGQRKRVSVAMELLSRPELLILDEPTSGLDPGLEAKMMELFAGVARSGRVVIVATHAMQSLACCDALAVLAGGLLVYFGPPADAPAFFGARDLVDLFARLATERPEAWAARYRQSGLATSFAARARPMSPAPASGEPAANPLAARASLVAELERLKAARAKGDA